MQTPVIHLVRVPILNIELGKPGSAQKLKDFLTFYEMEKTMEVNDVKIIPIK